MFDPDKVRATAERAVDAYAKAYEHELGRMPRARRVAVAAALNELAIDSGDAGHYAAAVADALLDPESAHAG